MVPSTGLVTTVYDRSLRALSACACACASAACASASAFLAVCHSKAEMTWAAYSSCLLSAVICAVATAARVLRTFASAVLRAAL